MTFDREESLEPGVSSGAFGVPFDPKVTGRDFELALHRAEQLLSYVDNAQRRLATTRLVSLIFATVLALVIALLATYSADVVRAGIALAEGACALMVIAVLARSWTARIRKQVRRDELSMIDLVNMLRDLWPLVAEEEKWDDTRNKSTQIRIERFPIGADSFRPRRRPR